MPGIILGPGDTSRLKDNFCPHGGYRIAEIDNKWVNKKMNCTVEDKCREEK